MRYSNLKKYFSTYPPPTLIHLSHRLTSASFDCCRSHFRISVSTSSSSAKRLPATCTHATIEGVFYVVRAATVAIQWCGKHTSTTLEGLCLLRGPCRGVILKTTGAAVEAGEIVPDTQWIGGYVGPMVGLDAVEKRRILPLTGIESRLSSP
jgi:hypothetical protein